MGGTASFPCRPAQPATDGQRRAIWAAGRKLSTLAGSEDDAPLRAIVQAETGQESTRGLTMDQARRVLERLDRELAAYTRPAPATEARPHEPWGPRVGGPREEETVTPAMQKTIQGLARSLGWSSEQLQGFARRQCGKPWPQTEGDADKIIEALKAMVTRGVTVASMKARLQALAAHPQLSRWGRDFTADVLRDFSQHGGRVSAGRVGKILELERQCGITPAGSSS